MPSFKKIFKSLWYAWHVRNLGQVLFVFLFGLVFLLGAAYYATRHRLPSTPEVIDLETAHQLVSGTLPHYVQLSAEPDFSKKIYRTGAWAPFWGNCPPGEIQEINAAGIEADDLRQLLGCAVSLSGRIDIGDARTVRWLQPGAADGAMTVALAPVMGTRERIWVKSKVAQGAGVNISAWQTQQTFSGILATYDQALAALPEGLAGHARRVLPAMPQAYAICPYEPYTGKSLDFFTTHFWVPVRGSDRIFLWTTAEEEDTYGRTITGVLAPLALTDHDARDRAYAHFEAVTDQPLPGRIGVIQYPTAEEYNRKLSGYSGMFMIFGVLWTVCGLIGIFLYIVAPDLIYGAWKRAFHQLATGFPPPAKQSRANNRLPAALTEKSNPQSDAEPLSESQVRIMHMPPESPAPPPGVPRSVKMARAFKSLRTVDPGKKELYLAFIQDFLHPNNPDSGLVMISCDEDIKAVENALINEGQRYPGLAIHLLGINTAQFSGTRCQHPLTLAAFELRAYDYVVLCHAPSWELIQRVVITDVFNGWSEDNARQKAEASLASKPVFALMGRVFLIGDSENGPCQGMTKSADSSLIRKCRNM